MRNAYIIMLETPNQNGNQGVRERKRIWRVWLKVL